MSKFGDRLRSLRIAKGISQDELARVLGVTRSAVSQYERGLREPQLEMMEFLADYFNVDYNYLLGREDVTTRFSDPTKIVSDYYFDDETAKLAQELFENKELRALFDVQRGMSADDLRALYGMALALKRKERGTDDSGC